MIRVNTSFEGKCIEEKLRLQETEKQPVEAISPMLYTERKQGVLAETNPRSDRWEIAREANSVIAEAYIAKRKAYQQKKVENAETAVNSNGQQVTASPQN